MKDLEQELLHRNGVTTDWISGPDFKDWDQLQSFYGDYPMHLGELMLKHKDHNLQHLLLGIEMLKDKKTIFIYYKWSEPLLSIFSPQKKAQLHQEKLKQRLVGDEYLLSFVETAREQNVITKILSTKNDEMKWDGSVNVHCETYGYQHFNAAVEYPERLLDRMKYNNEKDSKILILFLHTNLELKNFRDQMIFYRWE